MNMGIEPFLVATSVNLIQAQRKYTFDNASRFSGKGAVQLPAQQAAQQAAEQVNYDVEAAQQQWGALQRAQSVTVAKVQPLRANLPTRGQRHVFAQVLQTEVNKPMTIQFTAAAGVTSLSAKFIFGSDEFPDQAVTDFFMFILDGVNYAKFSDGSLVSFVQGVNAANFLNNGNGAAGPYAIEYDGLSLALGVVGLLDPTLSTHTLKIVIGDTSDAIFDSGVFVAGLTAGTSTGGGICGGANQPACPGGGGGSRW